MTWFCRNCGHEFAGDKQRCPTCWALLCPHCFENLHPHTAKPRA